MFKKIMVPVDLAHLPALQKALDVAADMARHYDAALCYVGVTKFSGAQSGRIQSQARSVCA